MKRNVLFWRVFAVIILTVMITAVFTTAVFNYTSANTFAQMEEEELLPRARVLADSVSRHSGDPEVLRAMLETDEQGRTLLGAYAMVVDDDGKVLYATQNLNVGSDPALTALVTEEIRAGREISQSAYIPEMQAELVIAGVPYKHHSGKGGSVLLFVTKTEAMAARGSLIHSLFLSALLVMPLIMTISFFAVNVLVKPIRQMRDTAIGMAAGNYELVASDRAAGEIGQLGRSLNNIAGQLSRTIAALTLERNRLMQVLDGLSEGIVAVDEMSRVTHSNKAVDRLFGKHEKQQDPRMALVPVPEVWEDFAAVIRTGEPVQRNVEASDRIISVSISPVRNNLGLIAGAVGLFADVTETERLERTRRDYVANVSHELRTPLTAMRGLIEPLRDDMISDEETRHRYYDIILRETLRLSRLINDLMELSRLQSGALALVPEKEDLREIFYDITDRYQSVAEEHGLVFRLETDLETCPYVYANADRVEQITLILVDNAIKYTPEGGAVSLSCEWNAEKVTVFVKDTGIGISEENLPYVFDRFYKVDKAHSGMGSGLGLSIAKELLKQMNEEIFVESTEEKGTTFGFTLSVFGQNPS